VAQMKALIFDQDGVIADTERDGHRVAFNRVFEEEGLGVSWSVERYGQLLKIAGGKERMKTVVYSDDFAKDVGDKEAYIKKLHKRKTDIFMEIVSRGQIALRSGVARLVREAHQNGLKLAVCSTSNERAVHTLVKTLLGEEAYGGFDAILAGDVVTEKKPSPEIYHLATERLRLDPDRCVVIEDSRNGLLAAKGAGMRCVITQNAYTAAEDFSEADLVLDCLGDPGGETAQVIAATIDVGPLEYVTTEHLAKLFA
jgi:HAD superfamily hydrolase (TIGR01509 family)